MCSRMSRGAEVEVAVSNSFIRGLMPSAFVAAALILL